MILIQQDDLLVVTVLLGIYSTKHGISVISLCIAMCLLTGNSINSEAISKNLSR